ncbi:AMP-binding protein [Alcanivoracaceae bacterium MT1]
MNETELTALLREDGEIITERLDHWAKVAGGRAFFHYGEDDVTLTYADFGVRTDHIAGNLAALGIGKGDRVSVFTLNPMVSALMMFAIWKAGAVYCPVNFSYTGRLLSYQLNDTAPKLLLTDPALLSAVNQVAGDLAASPVVIVYDPPADAHDHVNDRDEVDSRFAESSWASLIAPATRPDISVRFDDPANVVYTSGTTGPAKGVLQPYRWMAQYTFKLRQPLTPDDVVYNDLPMYHVGGAIANVARAAWVGCEVAVWNRFSPGDFWKRVASRGATTAILLDVMIPWLTKAPERPDDRRNTLNKVHMQPLPEHHALVARRFGLDFVTAGFGQTESGSPLGLLFEETAEGEGTPAELYRGRSHEEVKQRATAAGMAVLPGGEDRPRRLMGHPAPFMDVAVLDEQDQRCGPGEPGQLAMRPKLPGLIMSEYLGKPEATVAAWRNLWFHTGDAAMQLEDGMFAFLDRLGDRIRVRGENLSSFQVEDLLNQHTAVALAAVFAIASSEGDEDDVVAYVTVEQGAQLSEQALHDFAAETMPKYMRPRYIRLIDEIPRTPTNKIEKYKLCERILKELGREPQ